MTTERSHDVRVLVVDDDALVLRVVEQIVRLRSQDVSRCQDAESALEQLRARDFDLVVTDLKMPGMSGLELATWITEERPNTRVVIMTGLAGYEDEVAIECLGARLVRKPFDAKELLSVIDELCA